MQEVMKFKPVRVKATTRESALEQALQMTGASVDEVEVEVLEQDDKSVTLRVAPAAIAPKDAAQTTESTTEEVASPVTLAISETDQDAEKANDNPEPVKSTFELSKAQENARIAAQGLLERMGLDVTVEVSETPENAEMLTASATDTSGSNSAESDAPKQPRIFLDVEGEDVGILIGKHGQTLRAFQYLLNITLNNNKVTEGIYVTVDAGNYRSRRAALIEKSTYDAAERVRRDHRPVRLEPMPAHERRLVHLLLQDEKDVITTSEGREPWRRVVVTMQGMRSSSRSAGYSRQRSSRSRNSR